MRDLLPPVHERDSSESELPPLPGFVGATAMMFLGIAMWKMLLSKRKPFPAYYLTPQQRGLLMKVIARGEENRWDFSFDEDFMFSSYQRLRRLPWRNGFQAACRHPFYCRRQPLASFSADVSRTFQRSIRRPYKIRSKVRRSVVRYQRNCRNE